jgi:hypothetical protein
MCDIPFGVTVNIYQHLQSHMTHASAIAEATISVFCVNVNVDRYYNISGYVYYLSSHAVLWMDWIFFCHHLQIEDNYEGGMESKFTMLINQREDFNRWNRQYTMKILLVHYFQHSPLDSWATFHSLWKVCPSQAHRTCVPVASAMWSVLTSFSSKWVPNPNWMWNCPAFLNRTFATSSKSSVLCVVGHCHVGE